MGDFIEQCSETDHGQVCVRRAGLSDAAAIATVHVAGWEGAYRGIVPDEALERRTLAHRTAMWEELLGPGGDPIDVVRPWVAVAERDGSTIGFAALGVSMGGDSAPLTAVITALYVTPSAWLRMRRALTGVLVRGGEHPGRGAHRP